MSTALLAGRLGAAPAGAPGQPPLPLADTRFPPRPPPGRLLAPAGREAPCAAAGAWPAPGACAGASAMSGGRGRACGAGGGAPPAPPGRSAAAKGVGAPWEGFSASSPGGRGWRAGGALALRLAFGPSPLPRCSSLGRPAPSAGCRCACRARGSAGGGGISAAPPRPASAAAPPAAGRGGAAPPRACSDRLSELRAEKSESLGAGDADAEPGRLWLTGPARSGRPRRSSCQPHCACSRFCAQRRRPHQAMARAEE